MNEQHARAVSEANGSHLLSYEPGRVAFLMLPSGEQPVVSVGTATVKVCRRRAVFGRRLPKTIASQLIASWHPDFASLGNIQRWASRCMVFDGLVDLLSRCQSLSELQLAWPVIRNAIEVAAIHVSRA